MNSSPLIAQLRELTTGRTQIFLDAADLIEAQENELYKLRKELGECQAGFETGTKAIERVKYLEWLVQKAEEKHDSLAQEVGEYRCFIGILSVALKRL